MEQKRPKRVSTGIIYPPSTYKQEAVIRIVTVSTISLTLHIRYKNDSARRTWIEKDLREQLTYYQ